MPKRRRPEDDDGECKSFAVVVIVEQNQLARFFFLRSFPPNFNRPCLNDSGFDFRV